jgi:hypothetical protein
VKRTGESVQDFRTFLLKLPAFTSDHSDKLLLGVKAEMKEANTINKLFDLIGEEYTSFLNCDIFQSILEKYCTGLDCEDLKYPEYLKAYIDKHKIAEFCSVNPQLANWTKNSKKLCLKFDIDETSKVSKVLDLKPRIAEILDVTPGALQVFSIEEGCVVLTLLIPTFVADVIFPEGKELTMKQRNAFQALSVLWIKCDNFRLEILPHRLNGRK